MNDHAVHEFHQLFYEHRLTGFERKNELAGKAMLAFIEVSGIFPAR